MTDRDLIEMYRLKACEGDGQAAIAFAAIWQASLIEVYGRRIVEAMESTTPITHPKETQTCA